MNNLLIQQPTQLGGIKKILDTWVFQCAITNKMSVAA